jgi:hypothetical protein
MLFSGDNVTGLMSGGATAYGFFLNNAAGLNNNWLVTVEHFGCIHLTGCIKRTDTQNQRTTFLNIEPGDTTMDAGTGSNNDVWVFDNFPIAFASLPSPAGNGSHGYCSNCATGRTISGTGGGNYVHRSGAAWVGEPVSSWSNVQFTQGSAAASSKAIVLAKNTIPGDFMAVGISCAQAVSPTLAVTDSQNNVYTSAIAVQADPVPTHWIQLFYSPAIVGGPDTITVSSSGNACAAIAGFPSEYMQVGLISPEDGAGTSTNGNGSNPVSGSFAVTVSDLVIGFWFTAAGGNGFAGSGFTLRGTDGNNSLEDITAASTNAQILGAANSGNYAILGVAFKVQP